MGQVSLDRGCPASAHHPGRVENRASGSARTGVDQPILVAGIIYNHRLNYHAHFWPNESPRTACFHRIELSHLRSVGDRSSRHFSGNASFNACAREFSDCLRCRGGAYVFTYGQLLVAGGFRASGLLFRLHLTTVRGKGERSARHPGLLLTEGIEPCLSTYHALLSSAAVLAVWPPLARYETRRFAYCLLTDRIITSSNRCSIRSRLPCWHRVTSPRRSGICSVASGT